MSTKSLPRLDELPVEGAVPGLCAGCNFLLLATRCHQSVAAVLLVELGQKRNTGQGIGGGGVGVMEHGGLS